MALSFAFGGDDGTTYDDLKRRRALAQAMWARGAGSRAPKTAMEGINSAAQSITGALLAKKLGAKVKGEQDEFGMLFNGALAGLGSNQPPMGGVGQPSFTASNPADEAFPVGQTGQAPQRDTVTAGGTQYEMGQPADMASFIKQGLVKRGLPEHVADGFVMNFKDESGLNPGINEKNPIVPGSRGGFGLAQWTGPRRKALESFAQQRGLPIDDPNLQMDFLVEELQGSESAAAQKILAAQDAGSAGSAIVNHFLRPAEEHRSARAARYGGVRTADATGGVNPMLLSMLSDPRANDQQRGVLQMLMQQQLQAADPMRQLQMQNMQSQIDSRGQISPYQQAQLDMQQQKLASGSNAPAAFAAMDMQAQAAGLQPGTAEYQNFMLNGGGDPATFRALDMQAQAAGFTQGTPEYSHFMATRGAGLQAGAKTNATNFANIQTGGQAAEAVAQGSAQGKANVEAGAELREMQRNMPGLIDVAEQLNGLAEKATYTMGGKLLDEVRKQAGLEPSEAAIARAEYIAVVDNQVLPLLRQTFGAAFTAKEGESLKATLGDPDKSPAEKKAVLDAFIEQKKRDLVSRGGTLPVEASPSIQEQVRNIPDFGAMTDEELDAYIEKNGGN